MRAVVSLDARAIGLSADEAIKLTCRVISSRSFSPTASAGAALAAALAGSAGAVVAFCFGSSFASEPELPAWRALRCPWPSAAAGSVVSGTGTDAVVGFSRLLRHASMAGQGQYQDQRRRGQQTVKSKTFHHVSPNTCHGA